MKALERCTFEGFKVRRKAIPMKALERFTFEGLKVRSKAMPVRTLEGWEVESRGPHPPTFFVSAHSKGLTARNRVSVASKGLKVAVFSMSCEWLVSADSKGLSISVSALESTVARVSQVLIKEMQNGDP